MEVGKVLHLIFGKTVLVTKLPLVGIKISIANRNAISLITVGTSNKGIPCKFGSKCQFIERCKYCDSPAHPVINCPKLQKKDGKDGGGVDRNPLPVLLWQVAREPSN